MDSEKDSEHFAFLIRSMAEEFGGNEPSYRNILIKFRALQGYSIEEISRAVEYLFLYREKPYFPNIPTTSEIIGAIKSLKGDSEKQIGNKAEMQADIVLKALKDYGSNAEVSFDDPVTEKLMRTAWPFNSWGRSLQEKDKGIWRGQFVRAYKARAISESSGQYHVGYNGKFGQTLIGLANESVKRAPQVAR